MTPAQQRAREYLRIPYGMPWKWDEHGEVIVWEDDTTIAFREEIETLLEQLAPTGLPAFTSIMLVLAACRGKLPDFALPPPASKQTEFLEILNQRQRAMGGLEVAGLAKLPSNLISSVAGKALLLSAILESTPVLSPEHSEELVQGLAEGISPQELNAPPPGAPVILLLHEFHVVARALQHHTIESLQRRLQTGLDALPVAAPPIELPAMERARLLLEALSTDQQHAGLALVVRDVMAAIHLPQAIRGEDDLSSGGASDLSNRGTLDRLLLSELAHDDLTLASRVALNEALYLRREPPARKPERALALLLDSGLRMWGIPRVLGVASALALIAHHRSDAPTLVWRANGSSLTKVNLLAQKGLEAHLSVLDTTLHPGRALSAFKEELRKAGDVDVVVITHRDALTDREFQAQLAALALDRAYLLVVERDGRIQLHPLPWGAPRPIAQVEVDVGKLFHRPALPPLTPLLDPKAPVEYPSIFRIPRFPLRLPVNAKVELAERDKEGGVCVTTDRRLFRWENSRVGAQQLMTDIPTGTACWLHSEPSGGTILIKYRHDRNLAKVIHVPAGNEGETLVTDCPTRTHPQTAFIDQDVLLLVLHDHVSAVSLKTGDLLAETARPPKSLWIHGRYFGFDNAVRFASWGGSAVHWDLVVSGRQLPPSEVLTAFDHNGAGAYLLAKDGRLFSPSGEVMTELGFTPLKVTIHTQGNVLAAMNARRNSWSEYNLTTRKTTEMPSGKYNPIASPPVPPTRTLQNRFQAVCATSETGIQLLSAKNRWLELLVLPTRILLVESKRDRTLLNSRKSTFVSIPTPAGFGCLLKVATLPDGSKAWLDIRGFLHLRSVNHDIPEISVSLSVQISAAAWTSEGTISGPAFFTGRPDLENTQTINDALQAFCRSPC